jgi:hypothetical protein
MLNCTGQGKQKKRRWRIGDKKKMKGRRRKKRKKL